MLIQEQEQQQQPTNAQISDMQIKWIDINNLIVILPIVLLTTLKPNQGNV